MQDNTYLWDEVCTSREADKRSGLCADAATLTVNRLEKE